MVYTFQRQRFFNQVISLRLYHSYRHSHHKLGNLRKGVFERPRRHAESGLFTFLSSGFANIRSYIFSTSVKKLGNTNFIASRCILKKLEKSSLPVDARLSKTPLLKLLIMSYITRDTVVPGPLDSTYFSCYFKSNCAF